MRKLILYIVSLIILVAVATGTYLWNKPHRDIASEEAEFQLSAIQLLDEFQNNYDTAWNKYGDKTISIEGTVNEVVVDQDAENYLSFDVEDRMGGVICYMDSTVKQISLQSGDLATIKGKVNGYDPDLFQEVEVKECVILKNEE